MIWSIRTANRLLALRWPRGVAVAVCAMAGTLLPAMVGMVAGFPEPAIHDEFSYLLGADTFAHGRLTNPSPPLAEFFEAPHVLVVPTYNSKYQPGQALLLALGQVLVGHPAWGVWLACGILAASLCWMLQAWTSRQWALATTLLVTVTLGTSTYWAQSYLGAMLPASGGALLYGGVRRILILPRAPWGIAIACGLLVLALTRPYEGLIVAIPAAVVLVTQWRHVRESPLRATLNSSLVVAAAVLLVGAGGVAAYNRAVVGDWRRAPYAVHHAQYFHQGLFLFSGSHQPARTPGERIAQFYQNDESAPLNGWKVLVQTGQNLHLRLFRTVGTAFGIVESPLRGREPYRGVLLWLVLLASLWIRSRTVILSALLLAVLTESLAWKYAPEYPVALLPLVIVPWVIAFVHTFRVNKWSKFLSLSIVGVVLGQSMVWWWFTHYAAPLLPLVLAAVATTGQRLARSLSNRRPCNLGFVLASLVAVHFVALGSLHQLTGAALSKEAHHPSREALERELLARGGSHLVFVEYDAGFSVHHEWVYNGADLHTSPVVFAHYLGGTRDAELIKTLPGRATWLVRVSKSRSQLELYSPGASDGGRELTGGQ